MKKRFFLFLLLFILLLPLIPTASAETYNGSCGAGVMWTLDTETGVLKISGEGAMNNYLIGSTNPPWYWESDYITSIVIEPGLTRIGKEAFSSCHYLTSITIPDTVTEIGMNALAYCYQLEHVTLPPGLTEIAWGAFSGSGLQEIEIPYSVTIIDNYAFRECANLKKVHMPETLLTIRSLAFSECTALTQITLPDSVESLGSGVFEECTSLNRVVLSKGLKTIGSSAFRDCTALKYISLPDGLEVIDNSAFYNCTSLSQIKLPDTLQHIGSLAFRSVPIEHLIIPASVNYVGDSIIADSKMQKIAYLNSQCDIGNSSSLGAVGKTIVYVHKGSTAEELAIKHGFAYVYITEDNLWEDSDAIYNPFTDVPAGSFYEEPVLWALENNITTGVTETTFNPNGQCLRAHVVTFLHRAAKSPEPTSSKNPFTDVKANDFFYKPVLWAVEKGITNGVSANKFGSYDVCNRAAVVTFLWRAAGSPEPESTDNPFKDVKTTDFFYKPVLWAVENGITNGLTATEFGPTSACNRAQVVTFLYRACNS